MTKIDTASKPVTMFGKFTAAELLPIVERTREAMAKAPMRPAWAARSESSGVTCWCLGWELAFQAGFYDKDTFTMKEGFHDGGFGYAHEENNPLRTWTGDVGLPDYNDSHSKEEIVAMLDRVIADLRVIVAPAKEASKPRNPPKFGTKRRAAQLLRHAASQIESGANWGWTKLPMYPLLSDCKEGKACGCALEAMTAKAIIDEPSVADRFYALFATGKIDYLGQYAFHTDLTGYVYKLVGFSIGPYNDEHMTSKADIVLLLRCLAYMLEHGGKVPNQARKLTHYCYTGDTVKPGRKVFDAHSGSRKAA